MWKDAASRIPYPAYSGPRLPSFEDQQRIRTLCTPLQTHRTRSHIFPLLAVKIQVRLVSNVMLISTSRILRSQPKTFFMRRASLSGTAPPTRSAKATKTALSHQERTATEPRERDLHTATVAKVTPVNDRIKLFRFDLKNTTKGLNVLSAPLLELATCADG